MIKKNFLALTLDNEKAKILQKISGENEYLKIKFLQEYCSDVKAIIENQEKAIKFAETMIENIFEEYPMMRARQLNSDLINDKLYISWDKENEKFLINFDKSSKLLKEEKYVQAANILLEKFNNHLARRQREYRVSVDVLNDWDKF